MCLYGDLGQCDQCTVPEIKLYESNKLSGRSIRTYWFRVNGEATICLVQAPELKGRTICLSMIVDETCSMQHYPVLGTNFCGFVLFLFTSFCDFLFVSAIAS